MSAEIPRMDLWSDVCQDIAPYTHQLECADGNIKFTQHCDNLFATLSNVNDIP